MSNCPQCGYDLTSKRKLKRVCSACHRPIARHDKWEFNSDGRIQHRTCQHPEFYSDDDAKKAHEPKPTPLFDGSPEGEHNVGNLCAV